MSNSKWWTKKTPEEQEAIKRFNESLKNDYYSDYDLSGSSYRPYQSEQQKKLDEAYDLAVKVGIPNLPRPKATYDPYEDYQSGGAWRGYQAYKPQTLDYRYIEQMANALASKHNVSVKVGDIWAIDLEKKELTYNPMTLMTGSKAQMIAGLLHEIGHLRHTTPVSKLKANQEYGSSGHEILNLYEDFRIDELMSTSYSGAGSVYEANIPVIESIAKGYGEKEKRYRESLVQFLNAYVARIGTGKPNPNGYYRADDLEHMVANNKQNMALEKKEHATASKMVVTDALSKRARINAMSRATRHMTNIKRDMERIGQAYDLVYDELMLKGKDRKPQIALERLHKAIELTEKGETILGYESLTICEAYGVTPQGKIGQGMQDRVDKTKQAIELARESDSTQGIVDMLNAHVYPHIRDLLLNFQTGENLVGSIGKNLAKLANEYARNQASVDGKAEARNNQKDSTKSNTGDEIPAEWASGEYQPLLASVLTAKNDLVQRLRYIRSSDNANKYESNLKRGKLHGKHLYRLAMGDDRLFRKKTEQKDRVGQVGISIIIDKSGSMYSRSRMIHTVRGAIILAEACSELGIPLEIMTFEGTSSTLKNHDEEYTKEVKGKLAGLVRANGGASNLYTSLDKTEIKELKKRNKVAVILSDGGVGRGGRNKTYRQYFDDMKKHRVVPVGVGVGCGDEITRLVGEGESTDNAYELPAIFDRIMRACINRTIKA